MDLTPEQKAVGKENFCAAVGKLRGEFLRKGIENRVASGKGLGAHYFPYEKSVSSPVRVGVIGTGDEGSVLIGAINPDFVQVTAIADIRPYNVYRAFHGDHYSETAAQVRPGLLKKYGWTSEDEARKHVKVYGDYRDLIAQADDIEAVIIALPLHLHAPAAIAAMKAGKHVLTEKLMGHSVANCKEMARVAAAQKLYLVTGHQRHYNVLYEHAKELIENGLLGNLHYIRAQWHRGNLPGTDSWQQPMPKSVKPDDPLADELAASLESWQKSFNALDAKSKKEKLLKDDLDKMALLDVLITQKKAQISDEILKDTAAKYGYENETYKDASGKTIYRRPAIEELIRWRLWERTGGGLMAELGSHQLDAASIFISAVHGGEKQHPLRVHAMSGRPVFPMDRDCGDHVYAMFEFPAPDYDPKDEQGKLKTITVAYASINGNGFGGYGETVFGTEGTLLLEREKEALLYHTHETSAKTKVVQSTKKERPGPMLEVTPAGDPVAAAIATQAFGTDVSRGYTEEIEHWAWCIRNQDPENKPFCHPKVALADAVIAHTSNLAAREGKSIEFKPEWFDPDSDATPDGEKPDLSRYS